jgi:hypothetical protein
METGRRRFVVGSSGLVAALAGAASIDGPNVIAQPKVHASFTKFQALVGPWDHVSEGAYRHLIVG